MQMAGVQQISASKQAVWQALNDEAVLRQSIPGCQSLEKTSDTSFNALVEVKVGPIGARFKGSVTLSDIREPEGYTLNLQGNGGIAGTAKGSATVSLSESNGQTTIHYQVDAEVGGRMAQLGGPIIDATAKQLAAKFFARFGAIVSGESLEQEQPSATVTSPVSNTATSNVVQASGGSTWKGIALGLLIVLVAFAAFEFGRHTAAPVVTIDKAVLESLLRHLDEHHEGGTP